MSRSLREPSKAQRRRDNLFLRKDGSPAVVSHRGNNAEGIPPNTVEAFRLAVDDGADWIETDVQFSADGDLVLHHNVMLEGDEIRRLSTREVRRRGLATLVEVADAMPERVGMLLDVKHGLRDAPGEDDLDLFGSVTRWADEEARTRAVATVSFCPTLLKPKTDVVSVGISAHMTTPLYQTLGSSALFGASIAMVHADDILNFGDEYTDVQACVDAILRFDVAVVSWPTEPDDVPGLVDRGTTGLCGNDVPGLVKVSRGLKAMRESA